MRKGMLRGVCGSVTDGSMTGGSMIGGAVICAAGTLAGERQQRCVSVHDSDQNSDEPRQKYPRCQSLTRESNLRVENSVPDQTAQAL